MIYLDNSATTKPFPEVVDSFVTVATKYFGNPSSLHELGMKAERLLTQAREQIAAALGVKPNEIIFTSGGTEANNFAIKGVALQYRHRGNHIITTAIEHPSVSEPCQQLEQLGFEVTYLPVNENGLVTVEDVKKALRDDTILVSIMHVNNEVGAIQPVEEIGALLAQYPKTIFHVDRVQGISKVPLDMKKARIDLCTMSAHKFHGLRGAGILYVRQGVRLSPLLAGGGQEMQLRSGTENVPAIVAMAKALRMSLEKYDKQIDYLLEVKQAWIDALKTIPFIQINTPLAHSAPHIINFSLNGIKPEVFVHELEKHDIFVSTTSACSSKKKAPSKTLLAMGVDDRRAESGIRISLSFENTLEEIPTAISAMKKAIENLREVSKHYEV
ncbi:cysteine desulfurase family protein [Parageobacillus thermoglucosidasius]|uniref:cysteine desulfurase family protein n=1 Tax=Parageobacillus thermoglucosidasius TaxID=1426 RepID=UPI000E148D09|nr:cysteine desulfurase family protein [Parageobacillus thermoglucosidasius]REK59325.1 MAG: cysteine desulfurase NifS [Geobacillus sp.]MED4903723.1 cysteine desulfurase family protein [Parageobacillus thermoglucosidasius]MED4912607.1 cysteine desulfurase family protein [Parageobacillus thermoglucosidasius]MED4944399.1 cysteine desulfurase family protein [Parageobacillus thermoglucosidasius]MED4981997.1 cysteine desulfurase family protein [Parageobacillus thermoglucosidasius]